MPELLQKALGAFVRHGLTWLAGFVVAGGIWTQDEATTYVVAATAAILGLGWSLWVKYKDRILLLLALEAPAGATETSIKAKADAGVKPLGLMSFTIVVALSGSLMAGCGAKTAPRLVGQAGDVIADSIYQLEQGGEKLEKAGTLPTAAALGFQERLLVVNNQLKRLPPILRAIDAAQKASEPVEGYVNQAIEILKSLSGDVSIVIAGVPVSEVTKPLLALVQAAQQTVTTVLLEIAKLRANDAPQDPDLDALLASVGA